VLARTLVSVVSTIHLVVHELIGTTPSLILGHPTQMMVLNDMSNPLEYLLQSSTRKRSRTPHNDHREWQRTITNSCLAPQVAPSHLDGENRQE
jgi:hypothetical protein